MSETAFLEKPQLKLAAAKTGAGHDTVPDLFPVQSAAHPYDISFEVEYVPQREFRSAFFNVFMVTAENSFQVDMIYERALPLEETGQQLSAIQEAFTKACDSLSVTFQCAVEKPMQMAGWTVSGGDRRFVLLHRGETEVLRNMAYVTGTDARALLGMDDHHPSNVARAQMVFKY